jgi:hypothetical protein
MPYPANLDGFVDVSHERARKLAAPRESWRFPPELTASASPDGVR